MNFKKVLPIFLVLTLAWSQLSPVGNVVVTVNETFRLDLSEYIEGDFLSFTSNSSQIIATSKFDQISSSFFNQSSINFTSINLPRDNLGNLLINFYAAFLDDSNLLYWAIIVDEFTAPNISSTGFNFTQSSNTTCYGLAVVDNDTIIIDCLNYSSGLQQNWLFTVSISQQLTTAVTPTFTYYNTTGTQRYLRYYNSTLLGFLYKTTIFSSVDDFDFNNTVVEIFSLANTSNPYPYWVIDRTVLNATTLSISGFDVFFGDVILVDFYNSTLYRITGFFSDPSNAYSSTFQLPDQAPTTLSAVNDAAWGQASLSVLVANSAYLYEVNWTTFNSPSLSDRYSYPVAEIGSASPITTSSTPPDASAHFIYLPLIAGTSSYFAIFRRGQFAGQNIHYLLTTSSVDQTFFVISRWSETVFYFTNSSANVIQINLPYLTFPNTLLSTNGACLSVNVSILFANQTNTSIIFPYYVINQTDYSIYYTGAQQVNTLVGSSPGVQTTTEFGGIVSGPLPQFTSSNSSTSFTLQETITSFNYGYTGNFTYFQADPQNPGSYLFFVQGDSSSNSTYATQYTLNTYSYDGTSFTLIGLNNLTGPVYKIAVALGYFVVVTWDQPTAIQGWYWNSPTPSAQFNISTIVPIGCTDLEAIYSSGSAQIICIAPAPKVIYIWGDFIGAVNYEYILDKQLLGLAAFSPTEVEISPSYPNYIFVNTGLNQVYVLDIALLPFNCVVKTINIVNYPSYLSLPKYGNRIIIVDNALVILAFNATGTVGIIEEWDISDINNLVLRKDISYPGLFSLPNYTTSTYDYSFASSDTTSSYYITLADEKNNAWIFDFTASVGGNNLYQIAPYNTSITNILSVGVASVDSNTDLVALASPTAVTIYNFFASPVLKWQPYLSNTALSQSTSSFDITVTSAIATSTSSNYSQTIQTVAVNTQYPITLVGDASNGNLTTLQNYSNQGFPALFSVNDNTIFNGTVLSYTVSVQNESDITSGKLQFIPKVNLNASLIDLPFEIFDTYNQGTSYGYVLTNNRLLRTQGQSLYDWTDLSFAGVNFNDEQCTRVVVHQSELYSVSFCWDPVSQVQWIVMVSYLSSHPSIFYAQPSILTYVNYAQILTYELDGQTLNTYLFVLESDPQNWQTTPARLHVYNVTLGSGLVNSPLNYIGLVDGTTFGVDAIYAGGFDVNTTSFGYRIFISDAAVGLRIIDLNTTNSSNPTFVATYTNDLTNDPAFAGQLPANVIWSGVAYVITSADSYFELIVFTQNSNHFYINWLLNSATGTAAITVLQGFLNFRGYTNLNIFDYDYNNFFNNFVAVVAQSPVDQSQYVLIYNTTANYSNVNSSSIQYSTVIGTAPYQTSSPNAYALQLWSNTESTFKLWTPQVNSTSASVLEYDLSTQLRFNITGNLSSSYMNLTAVNDIAITSVSFALGHSPNPVNPGDNSGPSNTWWIVLLSIVGFLIIVAAVYIIVKRVRARRTSPEMESAKQTLFIP